MQASYAADRQQYATGNSAAISGVKDNIARTWYTSISGGAANEAQNTGAFISGGTYWSSTADWFWARETTILPDQLVVGGSWLVVCRIPAMRLDTSYAIGGGQYPHPAVLA